MFSYFHSSLSLNNSLEAFPKKKIVAMLKPGDEKIITFPYGSVGLIIFSGAATDIMSIYQYHAYSTSYAGRTIGTQGNKLSYTSYGTNGLKVINNNAGNTCMVVALTFYGDEPY